MFNFKKQTPKDKSNSYQLTFIFRGERKDYIFYDLEDAVMCFYGKVVEIRTRFQTERPEFLMSLFGPCGDILMNYHRDGNEDKLMDLRPNTL